MNIRCCYCGREEDGSVERLEGRGWVSKRTRKNGRDRVSAACPAHAELMQAEVSR